MLATTINFSSLNSIKAKVELYNGSTLVESCSCADKLQSFTVDRDEGSGKFFGFGVCQSVRTELIDLNRELNLAEGTIVVPAYGDGTNFFKPYPKFYAKEITRDEDTNGITVVAYDALYEASAHTFSELGLTPPYSMKDIAAACVSLLGLAGGNWPNISTFTTSYANGANYSGEESLREVLDDIAEAIQAIYYINYANRLVIKRLDKTSSPLFTITKDKYFSLSSGANRVLTGICHTTELGDNVEGGDDTGAIQYIRDNPFWVNSDNIGTLLSYALTAVKGLAINEFNCDSWEGYCPLEIGDKIGIIAEDGSLITTFVLNDSITYDGTMTEATSWAYSDNDTETAANPITLGEKLNQTRARVDKALQEIELYTGRADENTENIASLMLTTSGIEGNVKEVEKKHYALEDDINEQIATLTKEVNLKMSAEDVKLSITQEMENGVSKVSTTTGFTFDSEGLKVSKTDSAIETTITEDGMAITKHNEEVLVANNEGVKAEDLHATTFLIIGNNSRFEDWGNRTACFWIGG